MHDEIYADAIGEITVNGSIVRIDLVSLSPTERDAKGEPRAVFRQRIILPVEGFANGLDLMQKAMQGLIDAGAVTRMAPAAGRPDGPAAAPGPAAASPAPAPGRPGGSPNFN